MHKCVNQSETLLQKFEMNVVLAFPFLENNPSGGLLIPEQKWVNGNVIVKTEASIGIGFLNRLFRAPDHSQLLDHILVRQGVVVRVDKPVLDLENFLSVLLYIDAYFTLTDYERRKLK